MENKYFTPAIEDIRIGYEFEYCNDKIKDNWIKTSHDDGDTYTIRSLGRIYSIKELCNSSLMRVPYLTKEQIETDGWELLHSFDETDNWTSYIFKKGDWDLSLILNGIPRIELQLNDEDNREFDYYGECKSINEFRTISKLLNIK